VGISALIRATEPLELLSVSALAGGASDVRVIDELLKNHKTVDFMMYPGEFQYFERAHVLRDAWTRVDRFFNGCLGDGTAGAGRTR
jgi:hypothetical protein